MADESPPSTSQKESKDKFFSDRHIKASIELAKNQDEKSYARWVEEQKEMEAYLKDAPHVDVAFQVRGEGDTNNRAVQIWTHYGVKKPANYEIYKLHRPRVPPHWTKRDWRLSEEEKQKRKELHKNWEAYWADVAANEHAYYEAEFARVKREFADPELPTTKDFVRSSIFKFTPQELRILMKSPRVHRRSGQAADEFHQDGQRKAAALFLPRFDDPNGMIRALSDVLRLLDVSSAVEPVYNKSGSIYIGLSILEYLQIQLPPLTTARISKLLHTDERFTPSPFTKTKCYQETSAKAFGLGDTLWRARGHWAREFVRDLDRQTQAYLDRYKRMRRTIREARKVEKQRFKGETARQKARRLNPETFVSVQGEMMKKTFPSLSYHLGEEKKITLPKYPKIPFGETDPLSPPLHESVWFVAKKDPYPWLGRMDPIPPTDPPPMFFSFAGGVASQPCYCTSRGEERESDDEESDMATDQEGEMEVEDDESDDDVFMTPEEVERKDDEESDMAADQEGEMEVEDDVKRKAEENAKWKKYLAKWMKYLDEWAERYYREPAEYKLSDTQYCWLHNPYNTGDPCYPTPILYGLKTAKAIKKVEEAERQYLNRLKALHNDDASDDERDMEGVHVPEPEPNPAPPPPPAARPVSLLRLQISTPPRLPGPRARDQDNRWF